MSSLGEALIEIRGDASLTFKSFPQWPCVFEWLNLAATIHEKTMAGCGLITLRFVRRVCRLLIKRAESSSCCTTGLQFVCDYALKLCAGKLLKLDGCEDAMLSDTYDADNPPSIVEAKHALPLTTDEDVLVLHRITRECNGLMSNPCTECHARTSIAALFTPLAHIDKDVWPQIRTEYYRFLKLVFLNVTLNLAPCTRCQQDGVGMIKSISATIYPVQIDSDDEFETNTM